MRRYWQPAALVDELAGNRPVKPVRLLGEDLVALPGRQGPLRPDRRGTARIAAPISPMAGSKTAACAAPFTAGCSTSTANAWRRRPSRTAAICAPTSSRSPIRSWRRAASCSPISARGEPPAFPQFDCFVAPSTHTFAFKGMIDCNWLQSLEVGIDPVHTSFLHRFFEDEDPDKGYGKHVPRHLDRFRHADDADHARVSAAAHRGRADRLRLSPDHAAPDQRRQRPCARHQSDVPATPSSFR